MMNSRDIIRILKTDGWYLVGTEGDHWQFKHPSKPGKVTVAHPAKDIKIKTLRNIEKQSGLKLR